MDSPNPKTPNPAPAHKHHDIAEDPKRPSKSRLGVKQSSLAEGGVDLDTVTPGKSGDANLA